MNQHSGSATLPRGFRYSGYEAPKTPEPFLEKDDVQLPSPPKPRLRLKRRVVSHSLAAPTQQFLASVAAADVPIPSIEEPESTSLDLTMGNMDSFPLRRMHDEMDSNFLQPMGRCSPPKTPVPDFVPSLLPAQYPNWTISSAVSSVETTPEPDYESSRPSTARSTLTSASLFSRFSMVSDDEDVDCIISPMIDGKEGSDVVPRERPEIQQPQSSKGKMRKAPWTKAMSEHLWATYVLYLQDPKVTPFRMGKSCLPPDGVCLRVAREAKRSWKGSKALSKATNQVEGKKSGSATPTAETTGTFIQWPHTSAATRVHLRELCKKKAAKGNMSHHFMSRGVTPSSQAVARHQHHRSTSTRSPIPFATQDMSLSLALSTSDSMQPNGPLAQLTGSTPENAECEPFPLAEPHSLAEPFPLAEALPLSAGPTVTTFEGEPSFAERHRLGSPFGARSYGPSSSGSLAAVLGLSGPMPRRQSQTLGARRTLQSPVRLSRSGTQKRRHTQSGVLRMRPPIGSDLWTEPNFSTNATTDTASTEFSSTASTRHDELFIPRAPPMPSLTSSVSMPNVGVQSNTQSDAPAMPPPRLGSPFKTASGASRSFPSRMHRAQSGSVDLGMLGRPFATIQQFSTSSSAASSRHNLAGRLAYIDQRLKELRQRETARRSQSPL
ncbi:hypothetical protein QBC35DRAFT_104114 [Podospora australis]|uniref:Uncharacterized protein n=1 Tax=Podospora australis TaxID=1536484 RepID=A0AAN7AP80_9PEZI|nr:hypothetical protein QBC35DRAFT_104114 [Podospora australis]